MDLVIDQPALASTLPTLADFKEDLRQQFRHDLTKAGYTLPAATLDAQETAIRFHAIWLRWIQPRPRRVVWSAQLLARALAPDVRLALSTIEAESIGGLDLNPRSSRQQRKAMFNDWLLNDWGVNHLHLGAQGAHKAGFAGSTSDLLFVWVADEDVYFLDVKDHRVFDTRCDESFVEIIHANWPGIIDPYRLRGAVGLERKCTAEERVLMRSRFINVLVETADGSVFAPIGGGMTGKGASIQATQWTIEVFRAVKAHHDWCATHAEALADEILRLHGTRPSNLRGLHVRLDGNKLMLHHEPTGILMWIS